jgi:glyceraldehyde 3-phosphate dehydrogenase
MSFKVAINGFGRVGRQVMKAFFQKYPQIEVVAINDITDAKTNAHLFKYDSNYGKFNGTVEVQGEDFIIINGKKIKVLKEKDPANLPWKDMGVTMVVESTGIFTDAEKAKAHIAAGAKKVIISAPAKNEDITIVMGVNEKMYDPATHHILSNASCTTNCLAPAAKVVHDNFKIQKGLMTTIHAYTNDQKILDLPHKDLRRARAAALSMIPTSTGAAKAVALVIPDLKGKFDGFAIRVPTPTVSVVDFVCTIEKSTTVEELNGAFKKASEGEMKGYLGYSDEPLVSIDYKEDERSSIIDSLSTKVMDGNLVKVVTWYDNEWGYSVRVADLIHFMAKKESLVTV